jgi:hypothetical protein
MQNSKTCNTFFSYNDVCNQLVKFHGDPLYLTFLPYSPAMSGLKVAAGVSVFTKKQHSFKDTKVNTISHLE